MCIRDRGSRAAERLNLGGVVVGLVLEEEQPILQFAVHIALDFDGAGICLLYTSLTFQEYFEHLNTAPERWGKPLAALLGALDAQMGLGIASIGGKDSCLLYTSRCV